MPLETQTEVGYEIKIKGHLASHWCEWFEGWTLTNLENGEVLLSVAQISTDQETSSISENYYEHTC